MSIATDLDDNAHQLRVVITHYEEFKELRPIELLVLKLIADDLERISKETKDEPR